LRLPPRQPAPEARRCPAPHPALPFPAPAPRHVASTSPPRRLRARVMGASGGKGGGERAGAPAQAGRCATFGSWLTFSRARTRGSARPHSTSTAATPSSTSILTFRRAALQPRGLRPNKARWTQRTQVPRWFSRLQLHAAELGNCPSGARPPSSLVLELPDLGGGLARHAARGRAGGRGAGRGNGGPGRGP